MSSWITSIGSYISAWATSRSVHSEGCEYEGPLRTISGRMVTGSDNLPASSKKINFFVKRYSVANYLGTTKSNNNGEFTFQYRWRPGYFTKEQRVVVQVVEERLPFTKNGRECLLDEVPIQEIPINVAVDNLKNEIGNVEISRNDEASDLTAIPAPLPSHIQSPDYIKKFLTAAAPEAIKKAFISLFGRFLTIEQVQTIYDIGTKFEKRSATAENLIYELLNTVLAVEHKEENNQVIWEANWDKFELESTGTLPNVRVVANIVKEGQPTLDAIYIKFRHDNIETKVSYDAPNIKEALFTARSVFALKGEAEFHLAEGHILPGAIAQGFFEHISKENPLYNLLQPHLSQLDFINWIGSKGIIFGSGSVLDISALTPTDVAKVIIDSVKKKAAWKEYTPQKPICHEHVLAKAEQLFYNDLKAYYTKKIDQNPSARWHEISRWAEACSSRIEGMKRFDTLEDLPHFCAWLVSKTTFLHWAAHSRQALLTDITQASLAGNLKNTTVQAASQQLFVARTLMRFDGDKLLDNPYGDVDEELLTLIRSHLGELKKLYSDIENVHITTQI